MGGIGPIIVVATLLVASASAQVTIRRAVPRTCQWIPSEEDGLRRRVADILAREVRLPSEREDFVEDLIELGSGAVPDILRFAGRRAEDRFVTEALLRIGGPDVRFWIEAILADEDPHVRQAFLAGVPAVGQLAGEVRGPLTRFLHDRSPQVRVLAIEKLHTLATVRELLTRCHDLEREVARAGILTVSRRWVFLDHGDQELQNLATFVGILEMRRRDEDWALGDGFLLAFANDRIADSQRGRELRLRARRLPWFAAAGEPLSRQRLDRLRAELGRRTERRDRFLAEELRKLPAEAGAELLVVLAQDADPEIRLAACEAGIALLDPELGGSFVRFLKDPDRRVRARAKELLLQTGFYADQKQRWGLRL